ncbi:hypothetical protein PR202_gb02661 [Eleusine coracana subsp. coracana]|uniref:Uncharacterized protein n=1 Tax=Eleusine coracana subsp. coracana TaxID=191504 RepID=A0AAV5DYW1_ELECO|nr:hypothetical protein PR202_gb02661 [Eleusine coracana subsp. coracana]
MAGSSLLLGLVGRVAGKAAGALVTDVARMWRVESQRAMLERHLLAVQKRLVDAEDSSEAAVKRWTKDLKAVAYEAEHVLDIFQYEALRRQARRTAGCSSHVRDKSPLFRYKASKKLKKVLHKINVLVEEMNTFGLVERKEPPQAVFRQTHSALDDSAGIVGREGDKEAVIKMLLDQRDKHKYNEQRPNVQVLPITGMGGLGKTTFAKVVYNDRRVQKHFELKMWCSVPQAKFDTCSVLKSILELVRKGRCDLPDTIELLKERLHEDIGQKRYLLILDDVWNEEEKKWEDDLKTLLCSSVGGPGSRIVVTSRSQQVASIMGTLPPYELSCLSEDDSWKLFSQKAFSNGVQEKAEFVTAGKSIVNKCKGLPLALKTIGGLMSSKQQVHEWDAIANSNLGATDSGRYEILPILKLSYMHLSPEMKQCFAFCAIFPKDHEMDKDMLIQLWIANSFVQEEPTTDLEQKVCKLYNLETLKLNNCYMLRYLPKDGCGIDEIKYMRQLRNRMELYNLRKVKRGSKANLHEKHNLKELSLYWDRKESVAPRYENVGLQANMMMPSEDQPSSSQKTLENLRSLEVKGDDGFFSAFSSSRVWHCFAVLEELVISYCCNMVHWPLEELRCMALLRSLHISHCAALGQEGSASEETLTLPRLERLWIKSCDSLQVIPGLPTSLEELDISRCRSVVALPSDLGGLANLRNLYVLGCDLLNTLPDGMEDLTSLEALTIKECPCIEEFPRVSAMDGCNTVVLTKRMKNACAIL